MSKRVILITGGNGGIGIATARAFLDERPENSVWLGIHNRRDQADALALTTPDRCRCLPLDVTSPADWRTAVDAIVAADARIDVLVNNAGSHKDMLLGTMPASTWSEILAANLDSTFHGCQAVLPSMISQRWGRIVNVSSLSALLAPAGQTHYAAAKAGIVALTQSLAKEVARIGITVNAVCPGYVDTDSLAHWSEPERKAAQARIPMRRFGKPAEIAAVIRFLACEEASYVTGSTIKIDGGVL